MKKTYYICTPLGGEPEIVKPRDIYEKLRRERAKSVNIQITKLEAGKQNEWRGVYAKETR